MTEHSDIDVAVEFKSNFSSEEISHWVHENQNDSKDLKLALGCPLSLHIETNDIVWPIIKRAPCVISVGKVVGVIAPAKQRSF